MKYNQIKFVEYLAKRNVILLLIDNNYYVAKSPEYTEIVIENNYLQTQWLSSNYFKRKMSLLNFQSEFKLHRLLSENLKSDFVILPKGDLMKNDVFLMEFINYDKRNLKVSLDENIDEVLKALQDIQLVFHPNNIKLKRKRLLIHSDLLAFFKNVFKITLRCRNFKSIYCTFLLAICFIRLYFIIPLNKTSIFSHGDLRTNPNSNFNDNPVIRNLGFEKATGKIFIHDFGSSQTKSRVIFKDIIKIFNFYPDIDIYSEFVKDYLCRINEVLKYKNKDLNRIVKLSVILVFFAEFSAAIDLKRFKCEEVVELYQRIRSKNFEVLL